MLDGFEALVRWNHPRNGLVMPVEFIGIAEETGMIVPIGWVVLRAACLQMNEWLLRYPNADMLTVSVNLSNRQFAQPDLIASDPQFAGGDVEHPLARHQRHV